MSKLTNSELRNLIMQEISRMVGEEALITKGSAQADSYRDTGFRPNARSPHNLTMVKQSDSYDDFGGGQTGACEQCGGMTYEGECSECGYMEEGVVSEGSCSSCGPANNHSTSDYNNLNNTNITPDQAFDAGYEVAAIEDDKMHHHKHNNYMAKPSLYKVAKYAKKLLQMIPDGYELDDWQRTKIAQISDDISEVYHSLDYDFYDDEC